VPVVIYYYYYYYYYYYSLLYNGYRVSFPGVMRPGRGFGHPPHLAPKLNKE